MKKYLLSLLAAVSLVSVGHSQNYTYSVAVNAASMTNIVTGPFRLSQIILTATTNTTGILVDSATNTLTYVTLPYTNIISYLTNLPVIYTNYFGVVTTNYDNPAIAGDSLVGTNYSLVDVTNVVGQATNSLPLLYLSAGTVPTIINNPGIVGQRGWWFTNTSPTAPITVTLVGYRQ